MLYNSSGEYKYKILPNNTLAIIKYSGYELNSLRIPSEIDGKKVSRIENDAFSICYAKNIIIPEGIDSIGEYAFSYSLIENITLPESIKKIGKCIFMGCTYLKNVVFKSSINKIPSKSFGNCISLKNVSVKNNNHLLCIADDAFENSNIDKVDIY